LPLHPWQARYLQSKKWYGQLKQKTRLIDLGLQRVDFYPTTSVRTLASFSSPWMLKPSLSVMITNSIRINLAKECHQGELTHRLWHSVLANKY
jgi:siderophore synthetase component